VSADPAFVTQRTMGRNSVRDAITVQAEESGALRRAIEEKSHALDRVRAEADARTAKLTVAQGEAARRLADVEAAEQHTAALLRQIAAAEDDVRSASSGFHIVSPATTPDRSEKGLGRILAIAAPLLATIAAVLVVIFRELASLRARTGRELAFFANLPVRWTSAWPRLSASSSEARELGREIAMAIEEQRPTVVGVVHVRARDAAAELSSIVADRLQKRGHKVAEVSLAKLAEEAPTKDLAEAIEGPVVRDALAKIAAESEIVLVAFPPLGDREAYRVATPLADRILLVVDSDEIGVAEALDLAKQLEVPASRVIVAVVGVSPELVTEAGRRIERPAPAMAS
jgi:hypothetical protein